MTLIPHIFLCLFKASQFQYTDISSIYSTLNCFPLLSYSQEVTIYSTHSEFLIYSLGSITTQPLVFKQAGALERPLRSKCAASYVIMTH